MVNLSKSIFLRRSIIKNLILLFALFFSQSVLSVGYDSCLREFSLGVSSSNMAKISFDSGLSDFNKAVEESNQRSPRVGVLCEFLLNSLVHFDRSSDEYGRCAEVFNSASSQCVGENREIANGNKEICMNNSSIATQNLAQVKGSYESICYQNNKNVILNPLLKLLN